MSYKRKIKKSLKSYKRRYVLPIPGILGNFSGIVDVPNRAGYDYVRVKDEREVIEVWNSRVPSILDQQVWVGYDEEEPHILQVLNIRAGMFRYGRSGSPITAIQPHHETHEWMNINGGNDVVFSELRQFMPFRPTPIGGMFMHIYRGIAWEEEQWRYYSGSTVNLEPYRPATGAHFALVYLDNDGLAHVQTGTGDFLRNAFTLTPSDIPTPIPGTIPIVAVRLWGGQTGIAEAINNTDIADLRFPMWHDHEQYAITGSSGLPSGPAGGDLTGTYPNPTVSGLRTRPISPISPSTNQVLTWNGSQWIPQDQSGGGGGVTGSAISIYDNSVFKITGSAISFDENLSVSVTGSVAFIDAHITTYSTSGTSNPPTEAELIAAFGSPSDFHAKKKVGHINDADLAANEYLVVSDGSHYWFDTLVQAQLASLDVQVLSTGTIAASSPAGTNWYGRASLETLSNGIWVLCYKEASAHQENDGALHIRFSNDYGVTWTAKDTRIGGGAVSGFPMNPTGAGAGEDAGEPWLYLAPNGNLILHMWRVDYGVTANGTYQSVSTDGGNTWSASSQINFVGIADDSKIFATDDHFIYNGVIYAGARQYDDAVPTNVKSIFIKSTDNGTTWEYISDISSFSQDTHEVALEYLGNGKIIALLRNQLFTLTYKAISTDMGLTWTALEDITTAFGNSIIGRARMMIRSHLKGFDNWWEDKVLLVFGFRHILSGNSHPRRNTIWISQDGGDTWSGPFYVDVQTEDAGYGDMLYDPAQNRYVFVSYQGTLSYADVKQYNLRITGI